MNGEPIIVIENVWKSYGFSLAKTLGGLFGKSDRLAEGEGPWALSEVSFSVTKGETLGIIGRNGAGKSTLLKLLADVSPPTRGTIEIRGRMFPMIELNAGLNQELTGTENIRLLGAIMGFSSDEMDAKRDQIADFCELGHRLGDPVRTYSSGMLARLGFAVAVHVDADILLIDEVLGVGDFAFQKKCLARIDHLQRSGTTIVFVSHNPYVVERICDRAVLLDEGRLVAMGDPTAVMHTYFERNPVAGVATSEAVGDTQLPVHREGNGDLRVTRIDFLDDDGIAVSSAVTEAPLTIRLHCIVNKAIGPLNMSLRILDPQSTIVMAFDRMCFEHTGRPGQVGTIDCRVAHLPLLANSYSLQVKLNGDVPCDFFNVSDFLKVQSPDKVLVQTGGKGMAYAPAEWSSQFQMPALQPEEQGASP